MKTISVILALISCATGLVASYYWYQASKGQISPAWEPEIGGDREKNIMACVAGNMVAFTKSGKSNKRAALWTALAVVSGTTANLVGILAKPVP